MMKRLLWATLLAILAVTGSSAQRADLSGLKFCIDPGHGGHNSDDRNVVPDPGVNFWESTSNLQKALALRQLLWEQGATVILTRTSNDTTYPGGGDEPSLTARWQLANANNVDWFHSIHSNASGLSVNTSINSTLMLVKENIPTRTAAFPEAVAMSNLIGPAIRAQLRTQSTSTWLDYTFYGGPNGGFNLGVLSGLVMPGELSEGSFHDYFPETRRLLNQDYLKMEAYGIRNAFMQYFGVAGDPHGIIAGIQIDKEGSRPLNGTRVRLLPSGRIYSGDLFNNGFYMFDSLDAGTYTVRFETPDYVDDSVEVTVAPGATVFVDRMLESTGVPRVISSTPPDGDTSVPANVRLSITFSLPMDTASVRGAFHFAPDAPGTIAWGTSNTVMTYTPFPPLGLLIPYTLTIDSSAHGISGRSIDGMGNGTAGTPFILHFTTKPVRVTPPRVVARFPDSATTVASPYRTINITFDEPLDPASVMPTNFPVMKVGGLTLYPTLTYSEASGRGGVNMYVSAGLEPGASYLIRVSGVKDLFGNMIPYASPVVWSFSVAPGQRDIVTIDSLGGTSPQWDTPSTVPGTTGIDSVHFSIVTTPVYPLPSANSGAGALSFRWDTTGTSWLLRLRLDSSATGRAISWTKAGTLLQAYVWGDGGGSQIRFCVEDSIEFYPAGRAENREVSTWIPVDWVGWRLLEWDLEHDSVGSWTGRGTLGGHMRFDSFQLRYLPGVSAPSGKVVIDQLQIARTTPSAVTASELALPQTYALDQNYPNPFNPGTIFSYHLPEASLVRLRVFDILGREVATLVEALQGAGTYSIAWNASALSSGVYFARIDVRSSGGELRYRKILRVLLLK